MNRKPNCESGHAHFSTLSSIRSALSRAYTNHRRRRRRRGRVIDKEREREREVAALEIYIRARAWAYIGARVFFSLSPYRVKSDGFNASQGV